MVYGVLFDPLIFPRSLFLNPGVCRVLPRITGYACRRKGIRKLPAEMLLLRADLQLLPSFLVVMSKNVIWQLNVKRNLWRPVQMCVVLVPILCLKTGCSPALSLVSFFICLCLALGTTETEGAGCKIRPLISKEQVKQAVKRIGVMQQNHFESPVFLS